jgi:hypothetical protein
VRAANICYKGERPEGYGVAHVTFDENKSDKLYAYWTPPGWDVHPGDKLLVMVSERSARKWTTVRSTEGLVPMGAEHKVAERHMPMPRERQLLKEMEAQRNTAVTADDLMDFKPDVMERDMHRNIQEQYYRAMAVPPGLLTPAKIRTLIDNHAITLTQKEPKIMINMETITYLNGKPIKQASDAEMFEAIRQTEAEIKGLMGIDAKPKALKERMLKLQADIDALVAYMDAR